MIDRSRFLGSSMSTSSRKHLSSRYRRERIFRFLGLSAVISAILFLFLLLFGVLTEGYRAFSQYYVLLDINFDEDRLDLPDEGTDDRLFNANYRACLNDAFSRLFPEVRTRSSRRSLFNLLSSGADLDLREVVFSDPSLIGSEKTVSVLLSGKSDLYLKNASNSLVPLKTGSSLLLSSAGDGVVSLVSSSSDFSSVLFDIFSYLEKKIALKEQEISSLARQSENLVKVLEEMERERGVIEPGPLKLSLLEMIRAYRSDLASVEQKRLRLLKERADLKHRTVPGSELKELTVHMPSYFIWLPEGVIKLTSVSGKAAMGKVLRPGSFSEMSAPRKFVSGNWSLLKESVPQSMRKITDMQIVWLRSLWKDGRLRKGLHYLFFTSGASREAERAGIWGAVMGSFYTMVITFLISFPLGVAAAIYLEEFAPKNRWIDLIEVNIINLAAVPSIVFGLLGVFIFLNVLGVPRSVPLAGGIILALMTLPTIIIASRSALRSVPLSIRHAALALGSSPVQAVFHHVVPLALPGMFTGTIIGMSQALGETAPLLMIGMVAFIAGIPDGFLDPSTVLPVQIYMWSDFPEPAFREKTAGAIIVLLCFLILMNSMAFLLRRRFERFW